MPDRLRLINIIGTRPQVVKYAALASALARHPESELISSRLLDTGQHYDHAMSGQHYDQLGLPRPDWHLETGSGSHGVQTARMLAAVEKILLEQRPDVVMVYGDTNSTLAGALAAAKVGIPVAHVESGLRSFRPQMAEEINRVVTDRLSRFLFCPTKTAVENLAREGICSGVHLVGDVMLDSLRLFIRWADPGLLSRLGLVKDRYHLLTIHRREVVSSPARLKAIFSALARLKDRTFLFPVHPRCKKALQEGAIGLPDNVITVAPLSYLEMLAAEVGARLILTDSGGVQKEAYLLKVPCIVLRQETEWEETVIAGWNILTGCDQDAIVAAVKTFRPCASWQPLFGDGHAAEKIISILLTR